MFRPMSPKVDMGPRRSQGMIELCPRLFPAFARFVACFPNGFYISQSAFDKSRSIGFGCDPLLNIQKQ